MQGLPRDWVSMSNDFRRQYDRKNYRTDITFVSEKQMFWGALKNISIGGAFIKTKYVNQLYEGGLVTLSIPYTDGNKHVKRKGRVLWKNDMGFAVGFY
jgi:hypothetical protein